MTDIHLVPGTGTLVPHPSRSAWTFHLRPDDGAPQVTVVRPTGGFYSIIAAEEAGAPCVRISEIASGLALHLVPLAGGGIACVERRTDAVRDGTGPKLPLVSFQSSERRMVFGRDGVGAAGGVPELSMSTDRRRVVIDAHLCGTSLLELVLDFPDGNLRVAATNAVSMAATFLDAEGVAVDGPDGRILLSDPDPMGRRPRAA